MNIQTEECKGGYIEILISRRKERDANTGTLQERVLGLKWTEIIWGRE